MSVSTKSVALISLFFIATWATPISAQKITDEVLDDAIQQLRAKNWTAENLENAVDGLLERELVYSAGYWVSEGEAAEQRGEFPKDEAKCLGQLRKNQIRGAPSAARQLSRNLVRFAEDLIKVKAFESARTFLGYAQISLQVWPDTATQKHHDRAMKKAKDSDDIWAKKTPDLREEERELKTTWEEAAKTYLQDGLAEFEIQGTAAGYLLLLGLCDAASEDRGLVVAKLQQAARAQMFADALIVKAHLWLLSSNRNGVYVDGKKVGIQESLYSFTYLKEEGDMKEAQPIDFDVWRGSRVVVTANEESEDEDRSNKLSTKYRDYVVCLKMKTESDCPHSGWKTAKGERVGDADNATLSTPMRGQIHRINSKIAETMNADREGDPYIHSVSFNSRRSGSTHPVHPYIEKFFARYKLEGEWLNGDEKPILYVLDFN